MGLRICIILILFASVKYSKAQPFKIYTSFEEALANPEQVYQLTIRKKGLNKIPPEIGKLINLHTLILEKNFIAEVPKEIGLLTKLKVLDLDQNQIKSLPEEIGNLVLLNELDLDKNLLRQLPSSIGKLTRLTHLDINSNWLDSLPEEIGNLKNLLEFKLHNNPLQKLPVSFGNLTQLRLLNLSNCKLKTLPAGIGNLKLVTELNLSYNQIQYLPAEIGMMTGLTKLYADKNLLSNFPPEMGNCTSLTQISVNENKITGLPASLSKLDKLSFLFLNKNLLDSIPTALCHNSSLAHLQLNENRIKNIPPEIGKCTQLKYLELRYNLIEEIPFELTRLRLLHGLYLTGNPLKKIPKEIEKLENLNEFSLDPSSVKYLPAEFISLRNLRTIYLGETITEYKPVQTVNKEYLVNMMARAQAISPEMKRSLSKQLWMNELVNGIERNGSVWSLNNKNGYEDEGATLFQFLLSTASVEDLVVLTDDPAPTVRVYAFKALEKKNYTDIYSLIIKHLDDAEVPNRALVPAGNFFVGSKLITPQQRKYLDSLMIFEYHKISYVDFILDTLKPLEKYYQRAREMSKYSSPAVVFLAKYKKEADVEIIKNRILSDPAFALEAVENYPHPEFKNVLTQLAGNKNFIYGFIPAVAAYRDSFAVAQLQQIISTLKAGNYENEQTLNAIIRNRDVSLAPVYIAAFEKNKCLEDDSLMSFLQKKDLPTWTEIMKIKISGCTYISDKKRLGMAAELEKLQPEVYKNLLAEIISQQKLHREDMEYFYNSAKNYKDTIVYLALKSVLTSTENDYAADAAKVIYSYNDTARTTELVKLLAFKKHLYTWQVKEIRDWLIQKKLLQRVIAYTKFRPDEIYGEWNFVSLKKKDTIARKAPEWSEIRFNENGTYIIILGGDRCIGSFKPENGIKIDSSFDCRPNFDDDYMLLNLSSGFVAPRPITSAPTPIRHYYYYRADKPDTTSSFYYEANIKSMLANVNQFTVSKNKLDLNGEDEIVLKRKDDWYADWTKEPVKSNSAQNKYLPSADTKPYSPKKRSLKNIPATIAGKPLAFYLGRKDIDRNAKLFIQGKLSIYTEDHDERVIAMLDSAFTKNSVTSIFYLHVLNAIIDIAAKTESYTINYQLETYCRTYILKYPCTFFKEVKHGPFKLNYPKWVSIFAVSSKYFQLEMLKGGISYNMNENCFQYSNDITEFFRLVEARRND